MAPRNTWTRVRNGETQIAVRVMRVRPPNFVQIPKELGGGSIDVADISERHLRQLGRWFTADLLANAAKRRASR